MTEVIRQCRKCGLCENQKPLLDEEHSCQIFWVGLSAKKVHFDNEPPLSIQTNSGRMIHMIEEMCGDITTYKTNLVKCLPLNEQKKLRYPNKWEIDCCYGHLSGEIKAMSPRIVFLLGEKVSSAVERHFGVHFPNWQDFSYGYQEYHDVFYVPIHHPSYIYVYKRKQMDDYFASVKSVACKLL